jgi:phospholipid/cholesterol/gamma-HCH transport system substrate-binding protein
MLRRSRLLLTPLVTAGLLALPACSSGGGGYEITAYFDKTVSLYEQGDVKILGLSAGKITDIEVIDTKVRVKMRIKDGTNLPEDVQATIVPLSLIGERYVQLFPAWTSGEATAKAGTVIPLERTQIPVEPDQALAALKKFLDTLDPNATGRLIKNLSADLKGNGQTLNDALGGFAELTETLAAKDQQIANLIENFDRFTATLRTRETQLGRAMDQFAQTTDLLADERETIARLIKALANTSSSGLDLVSEHGGALNTDVQTLTKALESVNANIEHVRAFLTATPQLVAGVNLDGQQGLIKAYDPTFKHIDLRQATTPTIALLLQALGIPATGVCLPIDVSCTPTSTAASTPPAPPAPPSSLSTGTVPVERSIPRPSVVHRAARWFAEALG